MKTRNSKLQHDGTVSPKELSNMKSKIPVKSGRGRAKRKAGGKKTDRPSSVVTTESDTGPDTPRSEQEPDTKPVAMVSPDPEEVVDRRGRKVRGFSQTVPRETARRNKRPAAQCDSKLIESGTVQVKKMKVDKVRRGTFVLSAAPGVEEDDVETETEMVPSMDLEESRGTGGKRQTLSKQMNRNTDKLRRGTFTLSSVPASVDTSQVDLGVLADSEASSSVIHIEKAGIQEGMGRTAVNPGGKARRGTFTLSSVPEFDEDTKRNNLAAMPEEEEEEVCDDKTDSFPTVSSKKRTKKKEPAWEEDIIDLKMKEENLKKTCTKGDKYVGAHVSIAGGLCNAIHEAVALGARAFALFLKSQRTWNFKPLSQEDADIFKRTLKMYQFSPAMVIPHGSYLMNCGSPKPDILVKSRAMLVEELQRCDKLGLNLFNFHPGSTCGQGSVEECIGRIAESINHGLEQSKSVTAVIENMSCQGNTIGGKFTELRAIIDLVNNKSRVGICLDTCHAFAAGYDLRTEAGYDHMMSELDDVVGLQYIKALHINDSKGGLGCKLDRHEHIGKGQIGLAGFERIMQDPRFDDIPMVLETPEKDYCAEIKLLNSMI